MTKRYEIFLSSTFADLERERQFMFELVLRAGHIPVGMEVFEGGHRSPLEIIEKHIQQSDYFVLIVGDDYGSTLETGESYVEAEFKHAQKNGKPILVFSTPVQEQHDHRLREFKQTLSTHIVNEWRKPDDLKQLVPTRLSQWIQENPADGWVRAREAEQLNKQLALASSQRDVYAYLFNRLNPYDDISLTKEFVRDLQTRLDSIFAVMNVLDVLIRDYVTEWMPEGARVYFSYRVEAAKRRRGKTSALSPGVYRIGLSNSGRREPWRRGFVVRGPSNIDNVYLRGTTLTVDDARQSSGGEHANLAVPDEGSVTAAPVVYGSQRESVGVLGMSFAQVDEARSYSRRASEVSVLLSSVFFAYGEQKRRTTRGLKTEKYALNLLRQDLIEWDEVQFGTDLAQAQ